MFDGHCCTIGGTPIDRDVRWLASSDGVEPYCPAHALSLEYVWSLGDRYGDTSDMVVRIQTFLESTIGHTCPPLPELEELPIPPCPGLPGVAA